MKDSPTIKSTYTLAQDLGLVLSTVAHNSLTPGDTISLLTSREGLLHAYDARAHTHTHRVGHTFTHNFFLIKGEGRKK